MNIVESILEVRWLNPKYQITLQNNLQIYIPISSEQKYLQFHFIYSST